MAESDPLVKPGDWVELARYYGKMFPTASKAWIEKMCQRMIRTLGHDGPTEEMGGLEYHARLEQLLESVTRLPPNPHNVLMGGDK